MVVDRVYPVASKFADSWLQTGRCERVILNDFVLYLEQVRIDHRFYPVPLLYRVVLRQNAGPWKARGYDMAVFFHRDYVVYNDQVYQTHFYTRVVVVVRSTSTWLVPLEGVVTVHKAVEAVRAEGHHGKNQVVVMVAITVDDLVVNVEGMEVHRETVVEEGVVVMVRILLLCMGTAT